MPEAIRLATRAAALAVTRPGAADAIPTLAEAEAFEGEPHAG
jgi:sugar/nucleoside kinase (ribokinase family)